MITFKRLGHYGRLGNQMFQYASLVGIAHNRGFDFGINYSNKDNQAIVNPLVGEERLDIIDAFGENITASDVSDIPHSTECHERFHHFDEELFNRIPDNCDLLGYFQSEKYFKSCEKKIRSEFTFSDSIQQQKY